MSEFLMMANVPDGYARATATVAIVRDVNGQLLEVHPSGWHRARYDDPTRYAGFQCPRCGYWKDYPVGCGDLYCPFGL